MAFNKDFMARYAGLLPLNALGSTASPHVFGAHVTILDNSGDKVVVRVFGSVDAPWASPYHPNGSSIDETTTEITLTDNGDNTFTATGLALTISDVTIDEIVATLVNNDKDLQVTFKDDSATPVTTTITMYEDKDLAVYDTSGMMIDKASFDIATLEARLQTLLNQNNRNANEVGELVDNIARRMEFTSDPTAKARLQSLIDLIQNSGELDLISYLGKIKSALDGRKVVKKFKKNDNATDGYISFELSTLLTAEELALITSISDYEVNVHISSGQKNNIKIVKASTYFKIGIYEDFTVEQISLHQKGTITLPNGGLKNLSSYPIEVTGFVTINPVPLSAVPAPIASESQS